MTTDYSDMEFDGRREGEEVILIFRRHGLTTWRGLRGWILISLVGVIPMLIWRNDSRMFFIWLAMFGVGFLYFAYAIVLRYFSYYLVTNQRIRQVHQTSLFKKTVVDLGLDKIQSISYQVPNMFGTMFKFGTILIQTQVGNMTIHMAQNPEATYNILQNQVDKINKLRR